MSESLLSIENIRVRYGAVEVLKGVSFRLEEGQAAALIGANGAGKTTTLMAISGLAPVTAGRIRFEGKEIHHCAPEAIVKKGITQVPEGRRIFPRLSVLENLLIGASFRKENAKVKQDLEWILQLFPILKERENQFAGTLSGGEQQMLAIGRGLMARPRLLLLDEPSLGLAPKLVTQLFAVIREIHKKGLSILLVEQNAYQALQVADTASCLETGRVVVEGKAAQLRDNPAVRAAYLGG